MKYPLFAVLLGLAYMAAEEETEEEASLASMLQDFPDVAANWDTFVTALPASFDLSPETIADTVNRLTETRHGG